MKSRWADEEARSFVRRYGGECGEDLALRTYTSRLLGAEPTLVLHGGGNSSVKTWFVNVLGERIRAIHVKSSGHDMRTIEPEGHTGLDLGHLEKLRALTSLPDDAMLAELLTHRLLPDAAAPSIETLAHAFMPHKFVDHTHADAVLALTNREGGEALARSVLGNDVIVLDYARPGFDLALSSVKSLEALPSARAMVWVRHGLLTWGPTAREAYESTIELVTRAEAHLARQEKRRAVSMTGPTRETVERARVLAAEVSPLVRGLLSPPTGDPDRPYRPMIVRPLVDAEVLEFVNTPSNRALALSPPLTTDHLIRTKVLPLWTEPASYAHLEGLRERLTRAIGVYASEYAAYFARNESRLTSRLVPFDPLPRVVLLPGLGALCAGRNAEEAEIARDITAHALRVKALVAAGGEYRGLPEEHLFDMEYHPLQHAKLARRRSGALEGHVALVTGSAGAIGSGICRALLEQGAHLAVTDLAGAPLETLTAELAAAFGTHVLGTALDVTDRASVQRAISEVVSAWGGVDLVVINAGLAHVASLAELDLEAFRRLERVNVEGTLLLLAEAAKLFETQGIGGDVVLISTKNVFAPGERFGAYSATKAAAHQLARVASLELAPLGVRVNMVAPDAVFSEGDRMSGLWAEVGADRMRTRGLDPAGLEEYYRNRNLLKSRITATHVARAVLFFATRQTPTTGATLPVDGGLPGATPR